MRNRLVVLAAMTLGACGGAGSRRDDPANPPLRGQWSKDVHLAGITMNDASVLRNEVPFKLPADSVETIACIEPKLRTAEEFNEMQGRSGSKCRAETIEVDGADVTGTGSCSFDEAARASVSGAIELRGTQEANEIDMLATIKVGVKAASGQTDQLRTSYVMRWKRLGDCR